MSTNISTRVRAYVVNNNNVNVYTNVPASNFLNFTIDPVLIPIERLDLTELPEVNNFSCNLNVNNVCTYTFDFYMNESDDSLYKCYKTT